MALWPEWYGSPVQQATQDLSLTWCLIVLSPLVLGIFGLAWVALLILAPAPRIPYKSEKKYISVAIDGSKTEPVSLPCWFDDYAARRKLASKDGTSTADTHTAEPAEILLSIIVPAFNEEKRIREMLNEAVEFLDKTYISDGAEDETRNRLRGWEIIVVSDGSTDNTVDVVLECARARQSTIKQDDSHGTARRRIGQSWNEHGSVRVVLLKENRGKGGAVIHGMRHARGQYVIFADADGASRFSDVDALLKGCDKVKDADGRAMAIGSRHYLVGSGAVVERSFLRNALMHSFHALLWLMTPRATASIKDTQCGFKMLTRPALPYIVPYMHVDGWIFDVEMLMLAEYARIPIVEVSIGWREIKGSKLNVVWDSLGMAWSLFVLRASWLLRVYTRDF